MALYTGIDICRRPVCLELSTRSSSGLDTCRHSANPYPAFLVVVTYMYARLVVANWTFHVLIWLRTGDGRLHTSWNSLPDSLTDINVTLQIRTPS